LNGECCHTGKNSIVIFEGESNFGLTINLLISDEGLEKYKELTAGQLTGWIGISSR